MPPRHQRVTEGVAAAITGPATLGHWDSQRCGSRTTFYDTIVERRTAATLVFISTAFLCRSWSSCGSASSWVTTARGTTPGDNSHALVPPVPPQVCATSPRRQVHYR
ncbi:hypothetical protein E2C01_085000 [Portunus trituberculatus]|uniref:Uncharacterized protein n=1 Tax=Portunus trituberculatus TaxID=210409 RepID=A0A5B7J698_PORTR|nr:hypothetical protein [Portunus trituberculatus]